MRSRYLSRVGHQHCGMDVFMMSSMKELKEGKRRLIKMYLEEKLKAEFVLAALEKMWSGHLAEGRWP